MKLAFLPSLIAPVSRGLCFGGAEMAALELAQGLARRGHSLRMFGLAGSGGEGIVVDEIPRGTPILRPGEHEAHLAQPQASPFPQAFERIEALHLRGELEVLHLHLNDVEALRLAADLADRNVSLKVVITLHLSAVFPDTTDWVRAATENPRVTIAAPSRYAAKSYGGDVARIRVIPNGVDVHHIEPCLEPPPEPVLAWMGRRSVEKGLAHAIEIRNALGWRLQIAGGDAPEGSVAVPRDPRIRDFGQLPRQGVPPILARSTVTLVPSTIAEAHPLVALESLAVGTPVVAFDVGGLSEIVDSGRTGFLVPSGHIGEAVRACRRAADLDRAECRRTAEQRFDHALVVDAYEKLYEEA